MRVEDLALVMTPGLGTKGVNFLLAEMGSAEALFSASEAQLRAVGLRREEAIRGILSRVGFAAAEAELRHCERHGIRALASTDEEYPALLRESPDHPHILYCVGDRTLFGRPMLAMVGTREQSPYGERVCRYLIEGLAERVPDLVIVSGLAFGIDSVCHRLALECGLKTVAVVANSLPGVTPTQHSHLAREMVEAGGAILSELPSSTKQNGSYYVPRNRIIAGLCEGLVLIESPASGGSLVTAQFADDYHRVVMAVPGRLGDRTALGPNSWIRNRKAQMILSAEDIVRELMWDMREGYTAPVQPKEEAPLTRDEEGLYGCFRSDDPLSLSELQELSSLDMPTLTALLMSLELAGKIRLLPGNRYEKLRR